MGAEIRPNVPINGKLYFDLGNGADLFTVSKLLGHTKITTTQIYAKVLDEGRKKAVDAIPDI